MELTAWLAMERLAQAMLQKAPAWKVAGAEAYQVGYLTGWETGRQIGLAEGELKGRMELARQLEQHFGEDNRNDLTLEDARRIRVSQSH